MIQEIKEGMSETEKQLYSKNRQGSVAGAIKKLYCVYKGKNYVRQ
jgi:hypothetical protein